MFRTAMPLFSTVRPVARRATQATRASRSLALPVGLTVAAVAVATAPPAVQLQPAYERPSIEERLRPRPTLVINRPAAPKEEVESDNDESVPADADATEEEAQSAYDERTGEINWYCPCLGGMADGPCGEEFKAAFSCFVFSEADPKGIDCVDKFKLMQDCFRRHPEVYADEIAADEAAEAEVAAEHARAPASESSD
ncbi:Oxidoreductase [Malassezia caprae]|uniref:Mitochondrial intermembrane space import and assembly protein 40 n=1 Tax=Malassezia caprae TaxID=1381934 RepID=A0AAF0E5M1_9BASI|nr:Oxidoreductase [Malassezia caprae]